MITLERNVQFQRGQRGRKKRQSQTATVNPRVPHVSRLIALAIRLDELIRGGVVVDQAELARRGHVTRARLTQIMNLLCLAPDIQEQILFLPATERGRSPLTEGQLRPIASTFDWRIQRRMWAHLSTRQHADPSSGPSAMRPT